MFTTALCRPLTFATALVAALLVSGCGDDEPKPQEPTSTNVVTNQTTPDPVPEPKAPEPPEKIIGEATNTKPPFKTCHGMQSRAVLYTRASPPRVNGTTNIWSHCVFGGFTGTVAVLIGDKDGDLVTWTVPTESWGVNGRAEATVGTPSDRYNLPWRHNVEDPSAVPEARTLQVVHSHAPRNRLAEILNEAIRQGKPVVEAAAIILAL